MSTSSRIPTPWPLMMRRFQFFAVPVITLAACACLAGWIWAGQSHSAIATGEVAAVRVMIESKFDGVLEELPKPINLFDTVSNGQVVARLNTSLAETELRRLEQELAQFQVPATSPATPPPSAMTEWHRTRIDQLRAQINDRDLKAPISGVVVEILKRPGEGAQLGKPILTIAADHGDFIVGYVRQDQMLRPTEGMSVQIQSRAKPGRSFRSHVVRIGPQVEALPARHWRNPEVPEWGLPVQIAMPANADLKPGELISLVLKPARR